MLHECGILHIQNNQRGVPVQRNEELARFYFQLASESRLGILGELERKSLRMQEIAQKQNLTNTEVCRQLQNLSEALLIQKQPDGQYSLTNYGRLVLELSPAMQLAFKHRQYFLMHDFKRLPQSFISRLGELSKATLITELAEGINALAEMLKRSEQEIWLMSDQIIEGNSHLIAQRIAAGINLRSLVHERVLESPLLSITTGNNVERRALPDIPGTIIITEKEAVVSLYTLGGKTDYTAFAGSDPAFIKWARDLFNHYWEQGEQIYP